jgi:hypothetical protein
MLRPNLLTGINVAPQCEKLTLIVISFIFIPLDTSIIYIRSNRLDDHSTAQILQWKQTKHNECINIDNVRSQNHPRLAFTTRKHSIIIPIFNQLTSTEQDDCDLHREINITQTITANQSNHDLRPTTLAS